MCEKEIDQLLLSPRLHHRALDVSMFLSPLPVQQAIPYKKHQHSQQPRVTTVKNGYTVDRVHGSPIRHVHSMFIDGSGCRTLGDLSAIVVMRHYTNFSNRIPSKESCLSLFRCHSLPDETFLPSCFQHSFLCRDPPLCQTDHLLQRSASSRSFALGSASGQRRLGGRGRPGGKEKGGGREKEGDR